MSRLHAIRLLYTGTDADRCPLLEDITALPDAVMARGRVLKHDGTTTVVVVSDDRRRWVIKRYNTKNRWHVIRRALRTSRAVNCWRAAARLKAADIDTPRPVAVLEERCLGVLRGRSYFICELVEGETLDRVLHSDTGHRTSLIERAAGIVRRLAEHDIVHGDLKATNFIVDGDRLFLVDLDATRGCEGRALVRGRGRDLRRFMKNWAADSELSREFADRLDDLSRRP